MKNILLQINDIVKKCEAAGERAVLAIDGMSASGKTTLAAKLAGQFSGSVIHTDDFHLPFELRTEERRAQPGGNLDYERFASEVLPYLKQKIEITYGQFSCKDGKIIETINISADCPLIIVEGAYSMRPEFQKAYDLSICMLVSEEVQRERLIAREGKERYANFEKLWIPLENQYLTYYKVPEICDILI